MDLAVSNVNETAEHYHKVEHVPGVAEVVLVGEDRRREERVEKEGRRDRQRKREREGRKREDTLVAEGLALTLISAIAMSMREPRTMTKSKLFQGSPK